MNKASLKAFAKLQGQIKELEGKRDQMKVEIVEALTKEGVTKEVTNWGTFTRALRTSYKYSEKIDALVEKVKLAKISEEEKGIAQAISTEYLVFTSPKV